MGLPTIGLLWILSIALTAKLTSMLVKAQTKLKIMLKVQEALKGKAIGRTFRVYFDDGDLYIDTEYGNKITLIKYDED